MTGSTTHFMGGGKTRAIVYRHMDGSPSWHGVELQEFFADVERQTDDTRFGDPSYLAAKLVVWLADRFAGVADDGTKALLDFLSVGIVSEDPCDIQYRYEVHCDTPHGLTDWPIVRGFEVSCSYPENEWTATPVEIPEAKPVAS